MIETMEKELILTRRVALVGNPNVGKSVIFGKLTGRYVTVSNYPGTTVDIARGVGFFSGGKMEVIDTPGVISIFPKSEDERVTRDLLLRETPDIVIQVADAKNLRRTLTLLLELVDLQMPMALVLNMSDEARARGIEIDTNRLSQILGIPVFETVATTGEGVSELRRVSQIARVPRFCTRYLTELVKAFTQVEECLPKEVVTSQKIEQNPVRRFVAETLCFGDFSVWQALSGSRFQFGDAAQWKAQAEECARQWQKKFVQPMGILSMQARQQAANEIASQVTERTGTISPNWSQTIGRWTLRPWPGYPIALAVLWLLYEFVGVFGAQTLVGFFEEVLFGQILNPAVTRIVDAVISYPFLKELIVGEYGLFTMALTYAFALILPIVSCFFFFFGVLEDSGYLPRLAVMLDRFFRIMGLNGKAVLPMILGLGCDTMATLTTRVLDSKKERIIVSILLTLSVPCSAQLGAMLGMTVGLSWKVFAIWIGVILGTMVLVGWAAARLLPGVRSPFLMELPPIRMPQLYNLYKKVKARLVWYLKEAVPLFMLGTFLLFIADKVGLLQLMKLWGEPIVVGWLQLPAKATESFIIGFLRRDYGAAGFFVMKENGLLTAEQVTVALVVITLFMPCVAHFLVTVKERGLKIAMGIFAFVMTFSLLVGGLLARALSYGWIKI